MLNGISYWCWTVLYTAARCSLFAFRKSYSQLISILFLSWKPQAASCKPFAMCCSLCADHAHYNNNNTGLRKRSPALFFVKAKVYGLLIIHEKYERLRWLRITRNGIWHLWIVRSKRLVRSPIRSGGFDLKDCSFRIGCTFFGSFLCATKERDKGKIAVTGILRSSKMLLNCTAHNCKIIKSFLN